MKILRARANGRRKVFELTTHRGMLPFPYVNTDPPPTSEDPVTEIYVDEELDREAFTYILRSGREGTIHIDSVLEYNGDPKYLADLLIYGLTIETKHRFEESPLSAREISRLLDTSPAQLYRLLDPTNYSKSIRQLLAVLNILGFEVEINVRPRKLESATG